MPPRHASSKAASANISKSAAVRARKRKNADRSDDEEHDSDFDYTQFQHATQKRPSKSKNGRLPRQQSRPSAQSHGLLVEEEQQSWRTELSELKRAKRFTEEDRGFVFTRKKTTTATSITSSSGASTLSTKTSSFYDADNPLLTTPNQPPTPEGTPSRDRIHDKRLPPAKVPAAKAVISTPRQQKQPQPRQQVPQTPERNQESIVAIPMRETPMIKRNKDMRSDASRRSSFNMRGKRASSIGNGFSALPHPSVDSRSFYRHIAADDPPPVRMKQLMAWCARKSIDAQKSNSQSALKIAKQIEEDALAMLITGQFSVSWYSRPLDMEPIRTVPKKPHQQNVENLRKLKECEAQIAKLEKEDEEWTRVISSFNTFHATLLDSGPVLPPGDQAILVPESYAEEIEMDLLTADERSLFEKHCRQKDSTSTPSSASWGASTIDGSKKSAKEMSKWMVEIMSSLEKEVDDLKDTLYTASRFDKIAKQYTDQVLEQIASALDERQRPTDSSFFGLPLVSSTSTSSLPPSSVGKGVTASSSAALASSTSKSGYGSIAAGTASIAPSPGPDNADDPRQILRALSRLSL
ncbi:hypothetical protein EDD11_006252 [Mortierella claussenii]|nr:hypothetical protein EDD11_006252 [Mortierella claussenii]